MASRHQVPLRTFLWEYLGYPEGETTERRRVLYAIVVLRLGFGLFFLLRGWGAVFGAAAAAMALRLGDPARLGLSGAAADTTLFILGCTELGVGALLLFGAFTRVSAVTGGLLLLLYLVLGDRSAFATGPDALLGGPPTLMVMAAIVSLSGLLVLTIAGSPFLSADRALDKLEEEERDRAPAVLPQLAERSAWLIRLGLAVACLWLIVNYRIGINMTGLVLLLCVVPLWVVPLGAGAASLALLVWAITQANFATVVGVLPLAFIGVAYALAATPMRTRAARSTSSVQV